MFFYNITTHPLNISRVLGTFAGIKVGLFSGFFLPKDLGSRLTQPHIFFHWPSSFVSILVQKKSAIFSDHNRVCFISFEWVEGSGKGNWPIFYFWKLKHLYPYLGFFLLIIAVAQWSRMLHVTRRSMDQFHPWDFFLFFFSFFFF